MRTTGRRLRSGKILANRTLLTNSVNKSIKTSGPAKGNKKVTTKKPSSTSERFQSVKTEKTKDKERKENVSRIKRENNNGNKSIRCVRSSKKTTNTPEGMKSKKQLTGFRQMSLKESFSNQETLSKRLRPRKESRNYCEDSVLQQKNAMLKQQESKQTSEEITGEKSKMPVYKSVKLNEESLRNVSDVYDFKFDDNDSMERLRGKRKRRMINRVRQKKVKKAVSTKLKKIPPKAEKKESCDIISENTVKKIKNEKKCLKVILNRISEDNIKEKEVPLLSINTVEKSKNDNEKEHVPLPHNDINSANADFDDTVPETNVTGTESNVVQNLETNSLSAKVVSNDTEKQTKTMVSKPTVVSIKNLNNNKVVLMDTPLKANTEHFNPFRRTCAFNNKVTSQYGNMIDHSLINKSLSPIKKASENFDPGSPWRLSSISSINTFSHVKNLFQSTPQPRAIQILQSNIKRNAKDQGNKVLDTVKQSNVLETDNENISMQKILDKPNYAKRKFGQSARKFGTEITNLSNSVKSTNNSLVNEQYEGITSNREPRIPDIDLQNTINTMSNESHAYNDTTEGKENAAPKNSKSKKQLKNRLKKISRSLSPLKLEKQTRNKENVNTPSDLVNVRKLNLSSPHARKENEKQSKLILDPQPGPSGLQKNKSPIINKPLQQSNLNAFLNIPEMPESTRIITAHGIFDNAHSTPINAKPIKPVKPDNTEHMELDNAFGFKEDSNDIDLDISPIYPNSEDNVQKNQKPPKTNVLLDTRKNSALPLRILPNEIKKNSAEKNVDNRESREKSIEKENVQVQVPKPLLNEPNKGIIDVTNFSNTFDILEEKNEEKDEVKDNVSEIPLFTDFEPTHFTQPPKRLYKRKRNVRFNFSESGSEDEENKNACSPEKKKKKYGNLDKESVKRMREWVKNINETFSEIDHYELIVE